jgi:hypothetical protein
MVNTSKYISSQELGQCRQYIDQLWGGSPGFKSQYGQDLFPQKYPDWLQSPRSLLCDGYCVPFLGCETDHSSPSSAEVKNEWSHTSTNPVCPSWNGLGQRFYLHSKIYSWISLIVRLFHAFSPIVRQIQGKNPQRRGMARTLPNFCVVCIVCFALFFVLFVCICVLYYCHRVATQWQLTNISNNNAKN